MRTDKVILLVMVLLAGAFASGCAGNAKAGSGVSGDSREDQVRLEVMGDPGTEFSGSCAVEDEEHEEISGQAPQSFTYDLNAERLECEIASEGDIEANLTAGNTNSVQQINGGALNLTYQNGSISSSSSSSVSSSSSSSGETGNASSDATGGASNVTSESRDVSGFDEVELRGVGNLSINQTGSEFLMVEAQEGVLPKIKTEVVNNRLVLGPERKATIQTTQPINYTLTVKNLKALKVSGSGDVQAQGISTDELTVTISGTADVKISGEADSQGIDMSGTGDYQAEDLESKEVKVDVGRTGSAIVNVSEELDAKVSGAGSVEYVGDPTVQQDVSETGEVSEH
ncbi:MAG TPA: head GIN domain-containing protein [Rubrobacteraceae bacterium]|nr:head GIN domain-containing protein [Rubrobacteraceae bacterium]